MTTAEESAERRRRVEHPRRQRVRDRSTGGLDGHELRRADALITKSVRDAAWRRFEDR